VLRQASKQLGIGMRAAFKQFVLQVFCSPLHFIGWAFAMGEANRSRQPVIANFIL
jgi:hypothetical protein